jgi:hypothetical protein
MRPLFLWMKYQYKINLHNLEALINLTHRGVKAQRIK